VVTGNYLPSIGTWHHSSLSFVDASGSLGLTHKFVCAVVLRFVPVRLYFLQLAASALDFGRCFINHPYQENVRLINDTNLAAKYELLPQVCKAGVLFAKIYF